MTIAAKIPRSIDNGADMTEFHTLQDLFIHITGQGRRDTAGQYQRVAFIQRFYLFHELFQFVLRNSRSHPIDSRFFFGTDFHIDAGIPAVQTDKITIASVFFTEPLNFLSCKSCHKTQHPCRYMEVTQDECTLMPLPPG